MEPRIQYAKTSDGVSIAFFTVGQGIPLVWATGLPGSNVQREWQMPQSRAVLDWMGKTWRVIRFDQRGSGLSQRDVLDLSLNGLALDIEAVVDTLGLEKLAVWGTMFGGPAAIAYAARHPERVTHLILGNSYVRGADFYGLPRIRALVALRDTDWDTYVEALAHLYSPEPAAAADLIRAIGPPEAQKALEDAAAALDVTDLLPQVRCPTLVIHVQDAPYMPDAGVDAARELASRIPGASLYGSDGLPATLRAAKEFTTDGEQRESSRAPPQGMTAILFADIAGSTALTERLGDAAFREKARALDAALRGVIRENGGTPIEGRRLGDGVLAVFTSARQAIEAALQCGKVGDEAGLPLHLGLHAGDVIREEGNVYGGAVNIAARISALSAPGEVLVSGTVRSLARTSAGPSVEGFEDRGERELKGVSEPVRVWAVRAP